MNCPNLIRQRRHIAMVLTIVAAAMIVPALFISLDYWIPCAMMWIAAGSTWWFVKSQD